MCLWQTIKPLLNCRWVLSRQLIIVCYKRFFVKPAAFLVLFVVYKICILATL
jgi:hypothetical protein